MWDEEDDKKLRAAADNFQPAFDETAWDKMEKLLDENLPKEKGRKRILFFLPFILILAGFVFYFFFYKNGNSSFHQANVYENTAVNTNASKNEQPKQSRIDPLNLRGNNNQTNTTNSTDINPNKNSGNSHNVKAAKHFTSIENENKISLQDISSEQKANDTFIPDKILNDSEETISSNSVSSNKTVEEINNSKVEVKEQKQKSILQPTGTEGKPVNISTKQKVKKQNTFADNFTVALSAGPAVSSVGNNEGKLTADFGISAGYGFGKHLGLQSGVFISKKIYSATPDQYSLPAGSSYYYLQKINANCNVIDIPLNINYFFNEKEKQTWFLSAGLSSYLMKKENYSYFYKTPTGLTYNKDWSVSNQNKHFFSVLDLSVGYQYLLNKHFSVAAQPFVDLPLTGIGEGKVKLRSGGILLTIQAKPFLKNTK